MSDDAPKKSLLTSKIDFEGVDYSPSLLENQTMLDPARMLAAENQRAASARKPRPPPPEFTKNSALLHKKKQKVATEVDWFALISASAVLLIVLLGAYAVYVYTREPENLSGLSYVALPQIIINVDGHVARLQVSVQIDMADADWLKENKQEITSVFEVAAAGMSPQELRTPEGFTALQVALKEQLNQHMHTEKVQAVLLTELLLQDQGKE